jgi:peptidyl-prolyl cis-trans isomerase SurA
MIKKRIILITLLFIFFLNGSLLNASLQNKIIAKVGSQFISSFEIKNKIKLILFLTSQKMDQTNINSAKRDALEALISLKLKKEELLKFKSSIDMKSELGSNNYLINLATKYNTDLSGLKKIFKSNDIDYSFYLEEIKTELAWQKLIFNIYKDRIIINEGEIEKELKLTMKKNIDRENYNLAEIEIMLNIETDNEKKIQEIKDQINNIGFENTAIKFSISSTSLDGGNIGWVDSGSLSKEILNVVNNLKIGQVSEPIVQGNSFLIIKLKDKNITSNKSLDIKELKEKIITSKKNNLLNLYSNNHLSKLRNSALIEIK